MQVKYCFVICLLATAVASFAPPGDPIPAIRVRLAKYYADYPKEKVYLQSDKQQYTAGETVWFSGYVTRQLKPSTASGILYIELFNDKGFVVSRAMRPVKNGSVMGDIPLPSTLAAGTYYIRAYTAWMLNFSPGLFFYRKITVEGNVKSNKPGTAPGKPDFLLQFFPESGRLVSRLTSLVVIKALDTNGAPLAVSGKIINSMGDTVALIKTMQDGMGSFVIHCSPQTVYTALVNANGFTKKFALPAVQTAGVVLHTESKSNAATADSVFFHISRSRENKDKYEHLLLCARMDNHFSVTKIHFDESAVNDPLDTILTAPYPLLLNNFTAGVLQLSVLTEEGEVLAERSVFLHDHAPPAAILQGIQHNLADAATSFSLQLPPGYRGTLAVAVTDADHAADSGRADNIRSGLLIGSELQPGPLFSACCINGGDEEAARTINRWMIAAKPVASGIKKILQGDGQLIRYAPEKSMVINGRAFEINANKKTPLSNGSLFVLLKAAKDSVTRPLNVFTDSAGFFSLDDLYFHDTASIYVQTGVKSGGHTINTMAVEFANTVFDSLAKRSFVLAPALLNARFNSSDSLVNLPEEPVRAGMLQNVTVTARAKTHLDSVLAKYATGIFAHEGTWATTMDLTRDQITKNLDLDVISYLNGKVAGLMYQYYNGLPVIYWRFSNVIAGLSGIEQLKLNAPSFFLNENLLNDGNQGYDAMIQLLSGIRIADVAMIRIFKPGTMPNVPDNGPHGSIAIYLKNGTEEEKPASSIAFQQSVKQGYAVAHSFEKSAKKTTNATLYWNPALAADPVTNKIEVSVHNSGVKRLRVVAEGLDENGQIIQLDQVIQQ